ncbi:hypothetical protein COOONC_07030 [Cooperia oncophora]
MISIFALFLFVYVLIERFMSYRLSLVDYFYNNSPEHMLCNIVFGHSYQSEIYFRGYAMPMMNSLFASYID